MKTIPVKTHPPYEVRIEAGLISRAGALLAEMIPAGRAALVGDENVMVLYGGRLAASLEVAGFACLSYAFPPGEASKNMAQYEALLRFLAGNALSRNDLLVSLGGGVSGDLAGFAAASYRRGMQWIQMPSSLLAMVDASVGGKCGIDLPEGKNLAGTFYQPRAVLCDPALLDTLPEEEWVNGWGEIIKYAMIRDPELMLLLEQDDPRSRIEEIIARCVAIKADLVEADPFDRGDRRLLNFGHSAGHAIEQLSDYRIPHGRAVAVGMAVMTRAAAAKGYCDEALVRRLIRLLERYDLPAETEYSAEALAAAMLSDKKTEGGILPLIIPRAAGCCEILPLALGDIAHWLKAGGVS